MPFALAGAGSQATGMILEKKVLRRHKVDTKSYLTYAVLLTALVLLPLMVIGFFKVDIQALELKNLAILAGVIVFSIIANLLTFYAVKWEKVTELEPMRVFEPLFVILLAFIFYAAERQTSIHVLGAATIAAIALIFSHIKKHHLRFNKYAIAALLGAFFFALELAISRAILPFYNPITFYFIRCALIGLVSIIIFKPNASSFSKNTWHHLIMIAILWAFFRSLVYYGYLSFGVIFTTLLFILTPVFLYALARIFLKEKLTWRNIIATIIIIACIAYALLVG